MRRVIGGLAVLVLLLAAAPGVSASPFEPPRDEWFAENDTGHWSDGLRVRIDESCVDLPTEDERAACSLEAFQRQPFVVIAFVDTGINPYHEDFRAPEFVHHPSTYVEGFPADAEAVELSFDVADTEGYDAARAADDSTWVFLRRNQLHWFPGTRVIGAYSTGAGRTNGSWPERVILDDQGHGTGVASVAAGQFFGSNPNALIVSVEALGASSLQWATAQPWIDIVSNSWGNLANLPLGEVNATRNATRRGQTVVFSAGNGATNTNSSTIFDPLPVDDPCRCKTPDSNSSLTSPYAGGPSWLLTVGAVSPVNGQDHWWHSYPVDVSSFGSKWRAASAFGVTIADDHRDFGGTSCAAPTTAGALSAIIERARTELGDTVGGQRPGQVVAQAADGAALPESGPLADGQLTRTEAEALAQKTAFPVPADPEKIPWDYAVRPTGPGYYVFQGYGVVYRESLDLALQVLMGEEEMPDRSDVDEFNATVDAARHVIWGSP